MTAEVEVAEAGVAVTPERRVLAATVKPQRAADLTAFVDVKMTEATDVEYRVDDSVADD